MSTGPADAPFVSKDRSATGAAETRCPPEAEKQAIGNDLFYNTEGAT
jgi:hypothetical protein